MQTIITRGRSVEIPTSVGELSPAQYEYYCFLAYALGGRMIDLDYFRIRWFSFLLGFGKADYTILKPVFIAELERQAGVIDGFFVKIGERISLDFTTPVNHLPEYRGYSGPGDWLHGVSFGVFVECLTVLESLSGADETEVAEGYAHIARRLYNIPEDAEVPALLAFHAPTLLGSVWKLLMAAPVEINGKKIDFRIIFKSSGSSRPDDKTGWTGITFEVASAGLFGNVNQVEAADMWAVLIYLYKCRFEYNHEKRIHPSK